MDLTVKSRLTRATAACLRNDPPKHRFIILANTPTADALRGFNSHKSGLMTPYISIILLTRERSAVVSWPEETVQKTQGHNWTVKTTVGGKWPIGSDDSAVSARRDENSCLSRTEEQNERSERSRR